MTAGTEQGGNWKGNFSKVFYIRLQGQGLLGFLVLVTPSVTPFHSTLLYQRDHALSSMHALHSGPQSFFHAVPGPFLPQFLPDIVRPIP